MSNVLLGLTLTTGGTVPWVAPELANDDSVGTGSSYSAAGVYGAGLYAHLIADLGVGHTFTETIALMGENEPNYQVWTSDDGSSWTLRVDIGDWALDGTEGGALLYRASMSGDTGRYVRMSWPSGGGGYGGGNYMVEWRVLGDPTSGPVAPSDPPPYEPPLPAGPLLEIYTADPDGYRWGVAVWGEPSVWSPSGWQDVTPQGVIADVTRGTQDAAMGILARPDAGVWTISTYDPDRVLDPANESSPFVGYLVPGTPIRINHRSRTLRTGYIESLTYDYASESGRIRATDIIGRLQGKVPDDATLSDSLYARAAEVISEAGAEVFGIARGRTDIDLSAKPEGELSAWDHIWRASHEVLGIPYARSDGRLAWAFWSVPLQRGRSLTGAELITMTATAEYRGLFSVVRALDDDGVTVTERAYTPTPAYGRTIHERTDTTIDSEAWCAAVLADRALPQVRFVPGEVYCATADDVDYFAELRINEIVAINTPDVETAGRILGDRMRVTWQRGGVAPEWRFVFLVTRADATFLVSDQAGDPLLSDTDGDYLTVG